MERNIFSSEKLLEYINILEKNSPQCPKDYYVLRKFYVREICGKKFLILRKDYRNDSPPIFVSTDQIYRYVKSAHERTIHGGVKKTYNAVKKDAKNVKMSHVRLFVRSCSYCTSTRKGKIRPVIKCPIVTNGYGKRGQVDLIDIRVFGGSNCSFILNYQDNLTRFCILKPLKDKSAESVLESLSEIFNTLGAPKYLHTDNGGEFRNKKLTSHIQKYWSQLSFIRGKPYNPRSQGAVERCNQDVKKMLTCYINKNLPSYDLKSALQFIQFVKNTTYHRSLKCSPYKALFGQEPLVPVKSENLFVSGEVDVDDVEEEVDDCYELSARQTSIDKCRKDAVTNITTSAEKMKS